MKNDDSKTIFKRLAGSLDNRVKIYDSPYHEFYITNPVSNHPGNEQLWFSVRNEAATNLQLREMLEQAITFYKLSKED
jgi:hypothetical protein